MKNTDAKPTTSTGYADSTGERLTESVTAASAKPIWPIWRSMAYGFPAYRTGMERFMSNQGDRITVDLPWPPSALSPNARVHWSKKAKAAKAYRANCFWLTKAAGISVDWDGDAHLWMTFFPPDRRSRDDDNLISSLKSGRDGLAQALGIDDKRFRIHPWVSDQVIKGGCVRISISPGPVNPV